jgi:hypothetical protein
MAVGTVLVSLRCSSQCSRYNCPLNNNPAGLERGKELKDSYHSQSSCSCSLMLTVTKNCSISFPWEPSLETLILNPWKKYEGGEEEEQNCSRCSENPTELGFLRWSRRLVEADRKLSHLVDEDLPNDILDKKFSGAFQQRARGLSSGLGLLRVCFRQTNLQRTAWTAIARKEASSIFLNSKMWRRILSCPQGGSRMKRTHFFEIYGRAWNDEGWIEEEKRS